MAHTAPRVPAPSRQVPFRTMLCKTWPRKKLTWNEKQLRTTPFAQGPQNKGDNAYSTWRHSLRVGQPGAELKEHERRVWLTFRERSQNSSEWEQAMTIGAEHFQQYLKTEDGYAGKQQEAICLVCSHPANQRFITAGNKMSEGKTLVENPPKIKPASGDVPAHWQTTAWWEQNDFSRHEKSAGTYHIPMPSCLWCCVYTVATVLAVPRPDCTRLHCALYRLTH